MPTRYSFQDMLYAHIHSGPWTRTGTQELWIELLKDFIHHDRVHKVLHSKTLHHTYIYFFEARLFGAPFNHLGTSLKRSKTNLESITPGWGGCTMSMTTRAASSRSNISMSFRSLSRLSFWMVTMFSASFLTAPFSCYSITFLYSSRSAYACCNSMQSRRAWSLSPEEQYQQISTNSSNTTQTYLWKLLTLALS